MPYKKKRRLSAPSRLKIAALAGLALVTALVLGALYSMQQERISQAAQEAASYTPEPITVTTDAEPDPLLAVLGDSYSAGAGAGPDQGYAPVLAKTMGWDLELFAQGGTGYTNPGQAEENESAYPGRIDAVIAASPDVVIVQGSTNDRNEEATREAAAAVFGELKAGLPDATIIAVGPTNIPEGTPADLEAARNGIAAAAKETGVTFIDPMAGGWLADPELFADGVHPTTEGHKVYAERVAEALPTP